MVPSPNNAPQDDANNQSPFLGKHTPIEDPRPKADQGSVHHPQVASTGKTLAQWQAPEFSSEGETRSGTLIAAVTVLIGIIAYAIYTNSPLMAIVFILIGMISYLSLNREPETVTFSITDKGVATGKEFYEYGHLRSFWISEDHPSIPKELIIETAGSLVSHIPIPLADQNTEAIRSLLLSHIPEKKYEPGIIDTLGRILHI